MHFHNLELRQASIWAQCSFSSVSNILGSFAWQFFSVMRKFAADSLCLGRYENVNECGFLGLTSKQDLCKRANVCFLLKHSASSESSACLLQDALCLNAKQNKGFSQVATLLKHASRCDMPQKGS